MGPGRQRLGHGLAGGARLAVAARREKGKVGLRAVAGPRPKWEAGAGHGSELGRRRGGGGLERKETLFLFIKKMISKLLY